MIGHRPGTDLLFQTAIRAGLQAHRPIRMVSLVALDEVQPWADTPTTWLSPTPARTPSQPSMRRTSGCRPTS